MRKLRSIPSSGKKSTSRNKACRQNQAKENGRRFFNQLIDTVPAGSCLLAVTLLLPISAIAGPNGEQIIAGDAVVSRPNEATTLINQQSQRTIINWENFSIPKNELVRFQQSGATAVALNRVIGADPSHIFGQLQANGQVFLVNTHGVLFAPGSQINVHGLLATTLDIKNDDFLAGLYSFNRPPDSAASEVVNQGSISSGDNGYIILASDKADNSGMIEARLGQIVLASGNRISLDLEGDNLISVAVDEASLAARAGVENLGALTADGGRVLMTAKTAGSLLTTVVNNQGLIQARTIEQHNGEILLLGGMRQGQVKVGGTLDASAPDDGDGGFIETSGHTVKVEDNAHITTAAVHGATGTWLIDPKDYIIAASGGDITGAVLSANLGSTSITIQSVDGATDGDGDILVLDNVAWNNSNSLTLKAINDIEMMDSHISNTGGGSIILRADSDANNLGIVKFKLGSTISTDGKASIYYNPPDFATPTDFSSRFVAIGGGTLNTYMLVNDADKLQQINSNLNGIYALGKDIDASATSTWNSSAGFVPLGDNSTPFSGILAGEGHLIDHLVINRGTSNYVGLFGAVSGSAKISHLGLTNATIAGQSFVGGLAGDNRGAISNSYSSGSVSGSNYTGGLVGYNEGGASISNSHYNIDMVSINGQQGVVTLGGLYNNQFQDWITHNLTLSIGNYSTSLVNVGGIYSINSAQGFKDLLAFTDNTALSFRLTGDIDLTSNAGLWIPYLATSFDGDGHTISNLVVNQPFTSNLGMFGELSITASLTNLGLLNASLSGYDFVGGLVGSNVGSVSNSYASGNISGANYVGGLIGGHWNSSISNSYSSSTVTATSYAGGLVGKNWDGIINNSYSSGSVTATNFAGGLIGANQGTVNSSFWNTETSGQALSAGGSSKTTAEMQQFSTFSSAWDIADTGGANKTWRIYEGFTSPLLSGFLTGLTVIPDEVSVTYNGAFQGTSAVSFDGLRSGDDGSTTVKGSASVDGGGKNTGDYLLTANATLYSTQQGYDISFSTGTMHITKANLTLTAATNSKIYDALTTASAVPTVTGILGSDTVSGLAEAYDNKNVGTAKTLSVSAYTINDGNNGNNYSVSTVTNNTGVITKADLAVTGLTAGNKVYDASTIATLGGTAGISVLGTDDVILAGTASGAFADKNIGTAKAVTVSGNTISGTDAGNYNLLQQSGLSADITPALLTITAAANTKIYDTLTTAAAIPTATGIQGSDTVTGLSEEYDNKNVGTAKTLSVSTYTINDGNNGNNYTVSTVTNNSGVITKADLAVTGLTAGNKIYDANTIAALGGTAGISALGSDDVTLGGTASGAFADKNVGNAKAVTVSGNTISGSDAGNYNLIQQSGLSADITPAPLTITASPNTKTYNAIVSAAAIPTTTGIQGSDTVTGLSEEYADKNVGTGKTLSVTAYTINDGNSGSNYFVSTVTDNTGVITKADLAVTGLTADNKVYDANTIAALGGTAGISALGSDDVTLGGTASGAFADKNVGNAKAVTVSGNTISGSDAGNYNLIQQSGLVADITPASLTITAAPNSKIYDALTTAAATPTATGIQGSDTVTGLAEEYADKNAGTGKTLNVSAYTINDGNNGNNYTVSTVTNNTGIITKADLAVTGLTAGNKVYDANTIATLAGTAGISVLGTDDVTLGGTASGAFADKNAGNAKAVTVSGNTISGSDVGNYNLIQQSGLVADITPAPLTITAAGNSKIYDALTTAAAIPAATGIQGSDTVTGMSEEYADKNAGTGKTLNVSAYTINDGNNGNNYSVSTVTNNTGVITKADLTVTGLTAASKVYDANTIATLGGTASISALGSDDVTLGGAADGAFADKNVGNAKAITVSGNTISGTDAGNYNLVQQSGLAADITPAPLTITASTNAKTYDTLTTAAAMPTAIGIQGSDTVTGMSEEYADKNAGTGKTLSVTAYTINDGNSGNNYTVSTATNNTGVITKADLAISGLTADNKVYDTTTAATLSGTAGISPLGTDDVALEGTASGAFADKNAGNAKAVTVSGNTISGIDAGNYNLIQTGLTANITPAPLTITAATNSKTYDALTTAAAIPTTIGIIGSDTVSGLAEEYDNKNAGSGKTLNVSAFTINDGNNGNNYSITTVADSTGVITPAPLTITASTNSKTYDALTTAAALPTVSGMRGSDTVTGLAEEYADKNTGTGKTLSVTAYTINDGNSGNNYTVSTATDNTGVITKANLAISGLTADNKIYDSTIAATLSGTAGIFPLGTDEVTLEGTASGIFADKKVGTAKSVTVTGNTISGADAGNYNLLQQTGLTADITKADLAVTGLTAGNKIYDGNTIATLNGTAAITALSGDAVTLGGTASGAFADKKVGTAKSVTVSGNTISGTDADNYNLVQQTALTADITPRDVSINGMTALDKVYDATTDATTDGGNLDNVVSGDAVNLFSIAFFDDKNVGTLKDVTVNAALTGFDAGNYNLLSPPTLSADITPLPLSVTGLTANNKVYDGTTAATTGGGGLNEVIDGDTVNLNTVATFDSKDVGTAKTVLLDHSLSGLDAGNYTVTDGSTTADITALANLVWTGDDGNWSSSSNWAAGILPETGNVLAVTIPAGVTVTYDSAAGSINLDSLSSLGNFQINNGNLSISGSFSTSQYSQTGGDLTANSFSAGTSFNQTGGILNAGSITLNAASAISQGTEGSIITSNLTANSQGGLSLIGSNSIGNFQSSNSGSGNVTLFNTNDLIIDGISNLSGNVAIENTGNLKIVSPINTSTGSVNLKTVNGSVFDTGTSPKIIAGVLDIFADNSEMSSSIEGQEGIILQTRVARINSLRATRGVINIINTGGVILGPASPNPEITSIWAPENVLITALSPITVNGRVVSSTGDISLTASNGDALTVNAPVSAPTGAIALTAGTVTGTGAITALTPYTVNGTVPASKNSAETASKVVKEIIPELTQNVKPAESTIASDKTLAANKAESSTTPSSEPESKQTASNDDEEKKKEKDVPLEENAKSDQLQQRPLFSLDNGGVAGLNMVCK